MLFPAQVSAKKSGWLGEMLDMAKPEGWRHNAVWRQGGWGTVRTWRMEDGRLDRAVPSGPTDAWHHGEEGTGVPGDPQAGPSAGWAGDEPHRGGASSCWCAGGTPGAVEALGEQVTQRRRSRHQAGGSGASRDAEGVLRGKGLDSRLAQNGQQVGVGRVHICTLTKRENNMKVKWGSFEVKGWP